MPTFTTIALETLLEPRLASNSLSKPNEDKDTLLLKHQKSPPPAAEAFYGETHVRNEANNHHQQQQQQEEVIPAPIQKHVFIKPELYITPELAPIPESSSDDSFSPSPYVVNHKRRGEALNRRLDHRVEFTSEADVRNRDLDLDYAGGARGEEMDVVDDNFFGIELNGKGNTPGNPVEYDDEFVDPNCDSLSVANSNGAMDFGRQFDTQSFVSIQGEFFDAPEDFSSDGSISIVPSVGPNIESELLATKLNLLSETEKRKKIEDALGLMYIQWQKIGYHLAQGGLTFPLPSNASGNEQLDIISIEQFCQEVIVTRFVAEAMGQCMAHAEAELAAETIIQSKDHEISRLRDRLQYYETVNQEMSQRNQENIELARRQRHRKRNQQRWIWGGIGLMVSIGASVVAYSLTRGRNESPSSSSDSTDC